MDLPGHTDEVYCVDFVADKVVSGGRDRTVKMWVVFHCHVGIHLLTEFVFPQLEALEFSSSSKLNVRIYITSVNHLDMWLQSILGASDNWSWHLNCGHGTKFPVRMAPKA